MAALDRSIGMCPRCYTADRQKPPTLNPDGDLVFCCTNRRRHDGNDNYVFIRETNPVQTTNKTGSGILKLPERLTDDLLEPLSFCVKAEDGWTEFGVIESRLHDRAPDVFARHVRESGHRMFGPCRSTASGNRVSTALSRLEGDGSLINRIRPSTGAAWRHSPQVSYWLVLPHGDKAKTLTWTQYCKNTGRSDDWTDADRAGLTSPKQDVQPEPGEPALEPR